jgi:hypothetical protein
MFVIFELPETAPEQRRTVVVGLLAVPPDAPLLLTVAIVADLVRDLYERVDGTVTWEVRTGADVCDERGGGTGALLDLAARHREEQGWDVVVCVTDVPLREGNRLVVAHASARRQTGLVSLPALGFGQRALTRSIAAGLVDGLLARVPGDSFARLVEEIAPVHGFADRVEDGEVGFTAAPLSGRLRLVIGMVRDNRPGRAMLGLSRLLVAALGTAAFALATDTLWIMSAALDGVRLTTVMLTSIAVMVGYLVWDHGLWESPSEKLPRAQARLFNVATVLTLLIAMTVLFVGLMVVTFMAALLLIDGSVLGARLGRPVGIVDYLVLAWFVSSLATVGGAVGSGLERDEAVRASAYGRHPDP